jgi:hypothetical protein
MSHLRSLSSRQKKVTRENPLPSPIYNKNVQPQMKQVAISNNNIKKESDKSKITIADAIGLITIRLGKVEQILIDLNFNDKYLTSSSPIIDQNQNMNIAEQQLTLLNNYLERIENIEKTTKHMESVASDLRDTKDLLIKVMSKQEKNLEEQQHKNETVYDFMNTKVNQVVEDKLNEVLNNKGDEIIFNKVEQFIEDKLNELLNNKVDEIIFNKVNELIHKRVNELLKKAADEIINKNIDEIMNVKYNELVASSNEEVVASSNEEVVAEVSE